MIPDYLDQIQKQMPYQNLINPDKEINLYDEQIYYYITKEIYNYIIYRYICLGYNYLYAILDLRPDPVLIIPDTDDPRIELVGYKDFISLILFLENPISTNYQIPSSNLQPQMNYLNFIQKVLQSRNLTLQGYQNTKGTPISKEELNNSLKQFLYYYHEIHLTLSNQILQGPYIGIISNPQLRKVKVINIRFPRNLRIQILY